MKIVYHNHDMEDYITIIDITIILHITSVYAYAHICMIMYTYMHDYVHMCMCT